MRDEKKGEKIIEEWEERMRGVRTDSLQGIFEIKNYGF